MLTEERYAIILDEIERKRCVKLTELCEMLGASISTVRRDVNALAEMGKLAKVHGGAVPLDENFFFTEKNVEEKSALFTGEKTEIARYAASLVDDGDFVFLDAGTTTEKVIEFLPRKKAVFVTNGIIHAKKLAQRGFKVYIPGGEIKLSTEAIVGGECVLALGKYNFTKCFMGANGISSIAGFSTPDVVEAGVKSAAVSRSRQAFVLADCSKFDKITAASFAELGRCGIITDRLPDKKYLKYTAVREVL